jgi:predicted deacylase
MTKNKKLTIGAHEILPGETKNIHYKISESYLGRSIIIPVRVISSKQSGPIIFLTGGIHGDEMNSIAIIKDLMNKVTSLKKGILICIPVVNIFGFHENNRYLPDRRDLNRCFPGSEKGSLADRLAYKLFNEIIVKCNFGIDFHTGAFPRTNFPQIRADLSDPKIEELARAFAAPIILNGKGSPKTLRSSASRQGCPTIVYEAGEVNKFEKEPIRTGVKGIKNALKHFGMIPGEVRKEQDIVINQHHWIRSNSGGLLRLKVQPGGLVKKGDLLALCENLFTLESEEILSPYRGIIVGLTLRPAIQPGEPVCNIGVVSKKQPALI